MLHIIKANMNADEIICPQGKSMLHVGLPEPLTAFSASKRASLRKSRPTSTNAVTFATATKKAPQLLPRRASADYIKGLNIGLNFTREVVSESAPTALRFDEIKRKEIFTAPKSIISQRKGPGNKGVQGRHNAIGDPTCHQPCSFSVHGDKADMRRLRAFPVKPYLKKIVQEEESIAAQTSVAASTTQWDEYILNKLSHDTKDFIVNKHSHGVQRERLQQKVLSDAKEEIDSVGFKATQFMDVEPILVERNHGIEQTCSKSSLTSYGLSESDKETVASKNVKDEKASELGEEYIPKYLELGKPLQRNYMEKFMTKAQRKRETIMDPDQDKYVSSNYNRHAILQDVHPFTEDILQGKFSIHHPGNRSKIVFDTQTQYKRDLISCYPQQPSIWGPKVPTKRNVPMKGHMPWKNFPQLIITTYQRQVLADVSDGESCTTPGPPPSESFLERDELSHTLLLNALSQWRTTWYLDNKWRDSTLDSITTDMKDISEHVRITAAIACGAAIGYRDDWDLTEITAEQSPHVDEDDDADDTDVPISGYRTYSPSEPAISSNRSMGHVVVDSLQKLLFDKSDRVQVSAAVTLMAIGASSDRARKVLLKALEKTDAMVADTWAAVQCLAMENVTERIVVNKLISMSQSLDTLIRVTATKLLVRLSQHSDVILFMVADKLNNKLWINRYMACKVIQKIHTPLNKDILHKLLTLMWSDYSENIKSVAGETIGVKGYGHVLHEELCCRLRKGNEAEKVDALKRVIQLNMMTGRMKSVFLKCFTDDHVSVRLTSAKGAGQLKFSDQDVIEGLLDLISDDHSHKVKAAAIEALADIGVVNEKIISQLIWSAQYQQEGFVRGSACLVLAMLKVDTDEAVNVLRDRLTADADPIVKRASSQALEMLGLKPEKDASLITAIKDAVKKLGSREAILASIIHADSSSTSLLDSMIFDSTLTSHSQSRLKSRDSKVTLTQESCTSEVHPSESQLEGAKWPKPARVIQREQDIQKKKEKIQAVLCAQEKQVPTVKYLWRKETPTKA